MVVLQSPAGTVPLTHTILAHANLGATRFLMIDSAFAVLEMEERSRLLEKVCLSFFFEFKIESG